MHFFLKGVVAHRQSVSQTQERSLGVDKRQSATQPELSLTAFSETTVRMDAQNSSELALFNDCFELTGGARTSASKLCEIMKLKGYKKPDKHLYKWLDAHFADHEFVRKIRPRNVRTWLGIKPRVLLERCNACGASCIPRVCVDVVG